MHLKKMSSGQILKPSQCSLHLIARLGSTIDTTMPDISPFIPWPLLSRPEVTTKGTVATPSPPGGAGAPGLASETRDSLYAVSSTLTLIFR